jgi:opacity protein-like surface antigen
MFMRSHLLPRGRHRCRTFVSAIAACAAWPLVASADPLGLYLGASVGQSAVKSDPIAFSEHDLGWKAVAGIRPISLLGAEIAYLDFGHPRHTQGVPLGFNNSASASGAELLGVVYLPIPVPLLNIYAKGGLAHLDYRASSSSGCLACNPFSADYTENRFAYGAGAQLKLFEQLAARLEYDRVSARNGDPSLLSLGLIWEIR